MVQTKEIQSQLRHIQLQDYLSIPGKDLMCVPIAYASPSTTYSSGMALETILA